MANQSPETGAACLRRALLLQNRLRQVHRGAHIMSGTKHELADVVDSSVLLEVTSRHMMEEEGVRTPIINLRRARQGALLVLTTGRLLGYW